MASEFSLEQHGIHVKKVLRNRVPAELYESGLRDEPGTAILSSGALVAMSGEKTGRSPTDKRIVRENTTQDDVWWGPVNMEVNENTFMINRTRALDYLNTCDKLYVIDGFGGWDAKYRIKVRIITSRAYHALFMRNMLIRPTAEELDNFGEPDYVVYNAGEFPANNYTEGMSSKTSVCLHFERKEFVILGTQYAGEMKKGVFTIMNYLMPKKGVLSMHCSATEGRDNGEASILFGLSGTGKTTLSADPNRWLIGDDEHCWSDDGIFNIEGGCYAKMIDLSAEHEPEIFQALRFGAVLENVVYDDNRVVDFHDTSITKNTRGSYPIEYMPSAKIPCITGHPKNVIFLTCDAFGVLPPVSKLTADQAMYHFVSGYTAKVAGTEMGVTDPEATFSPCFGGPFLVHHPARYAELLADKIEKHGANVWLVNTGWSGGPFGVGKRMSLPVTRKIIDAIHDGTLANSATRTDAIFGFEVPTTCHDVDDAVLWPKNTWADKDSYDATAKKLAQLFRENFKQYEAGSSEAIIAAGPKL